MGRVNHRRKLYKSRDIQPNYATRNHYTQNTIETVQIGYFSLLVAFIGLVVSILMCWAAFQQSSAAEIMAKAAIEQTEAAKEQAKAAKEQSVSALRQANASDIQAATSQNQSNIVQNQYNASLPNLKLSIGDYHDSNSFIIPIEKQKDNISNRVRKFDYRVVVQLDMSNLSSLPISVTDMYIMFFEIVDNSFTIKETAWKILAKVDKYSVSQNTSIVIGDMEYPEVFVLQPFEAVRKYAVFACDYYPTTTTHSALLIVNTSRGQFQHQFKIHKLPGLVTPKSFDKGFKLNFTSGKLIPIE
jgi:hypothetical protein